MEEMLVSDLKNMPSYIYNLVLFIRDSLRYLNAINKTFYFPLLLSEINLILALEISEGILYNAFLKLARSAASKIYSVNDLVGLIS